MKILVADDHGIVREGLKQIILELSGVARVDEAENGFEVIDLVNQNEYDIIIMDISMPGKNGLDTLKELKKIRPDLPVLMLSVHDEEQYGIRVLRAGASGFIPKHSDPEEFRKAILKVKSGKKYLTEILVDKLATNLDYANDKPLHELLSDREYQVFKRIAEGKITKEIAEELFLSTKTVSTYRTRILEKMGLHSNTEIMKYALENKVII